MYLEKPIAKYLEDAASNMPAPGGGSVSALAAALGASMSCMVANFTIGKEKFKAVEPQAKQLLEQSAVIMKACSRLIDEDVEAYNNYTKASTLPKDTDEQKAARAAAMQQALKKAMEVPLNLFRNCAAQMQIADKLVDIGNPYLITDVGVSVLLAEAAMQGALLNVEVNLKYLKDENLVKKTRAEISDLLARTDGIRPRVMEKVFSAVR
jgi:formiminotetrahydrofolate cyclodeaminase